MKTILFILLSALALPQSKVLHYFGDYPSPPVGGGKTEINEFTVCKIDSEMMGVDERTFENGTAGSWAGLDASEGNPHIGNWGGLPSNRVITLETFGDYSPAATDSIIFSFWATDILSTEVTSSIISPIIADEVFTDTYTHYIYKSIFSATEGINISINYGDMPTSIYFDDFSYIWVKFLTSYKTACAEEPTKVYYNSVELLAGSGGKYVEEGYWDWDAGELFINIGGELIHIVEIE